MTRQRAGDVISVYLGGMLFACCIFMQFVMPCTASAESAGPAVTPENPYVMRCHSLYDTADSDFSLNTAGTYRAGEALKAAIYTVETDSQYSGEMRIETSARLPLYQYSLQLETRYTFYLGEGMYVVLPDHCKMHKVTREPNFQNQREKATVRKRRYMTWLEIPQSNYYVTNIPGEEGYFVVSFIQAELGEEDPIRVDVSNGDVATLEVQESFDTFVEFVKCIVWYTEVGVG